MKPNLASEPDVKYPLTLPKYGSVKLDGIRALTQYSTTTTRQEKLVPNQELRELLATRQGLDGELIFAEPNAPDVYHSTYSAVMTEKGSAEGITFYVFDLLDKTRPYKDRYAILQDMLLPPMFKVLEQTLITSQEDLDAYYDRVLTEGYEGLILRNPDAMYKEGRSTAKSQDMLKLKPFRDDEAAVTGVYEAMHNGNEAFKNELGYTARSSHKENLTGNGMIGGLLAQFQGQEIRIAAGKLKHSERIAIWQNPTAVVGKLAKFRHLPVGVKDAPRHARFIGWRSPIDL